MKKRTAPEYTSGCFTLYYIREDKSGDYPSEYLEESTMGAVWYRELSVFDRTKTELNAAGIDVTIKARIPECRMVNSRCVCKIGNEWHDIYNVAHVVTADGFRESEITLKTPSAIREVRYDQEGIK